MATVPRVSRTVIGIDPSATATGILELNIDTLDYRTTCIKPRFKGGPQRQREIYDEVRYFLSTRLVLPTHICMEDYAYSPKTAHMAFLLGEIGGTIKLAVWDELHMWPSLIVGSQAKKFLLGKGGGNVKITKSMILKGVFTKWGVDVDDDNLADAYVEARVARAIILQKTDFQYEQEVLDAIMTPTKKNNQYIYRFMTEAPADERDKVITSLIYGNSGAATTH